MKMSKNFVTMGRKVGALESTSRTMMRGAIQESLEDGVKEARKLIASRGTGRTWYGDWGSWPNGQPGRTGSRPGRVASGRMLDALTFEMRPDTSGRVRGRFGWVGRLGDLKYAPMQDQGFKHWITGENIKGMLALRDAGLFADEMLNIRSERIAKRLADLDF